MQVNRASLHIFHLMEVALWIVVASKDVILLCVDMNTRESIESPQMCMYLVLRRRMTKRMMTSQMIRIGKKTLWNGAFTDMYIDNLRSNQLDTINNDTPDENVDMNTLCENITAGLVDAASFMKTNALPRKKPQRKQPWFDKECSIARRHVRKSFRSYRKTLSPEARALSVKVRSYYKLKIRNKKHQYKLELTVALTKKLNNTTFFWKHVKKINTKFKESNTTISQIE